MTYLRLSHTVVARADSKVVKRVFQLFLRSQLSKALGTSRGQSKRLAALVFGLVAYLFEIFGGRCWKMLEDVNFFFVAACPWSSVPCERYILQTPSHRWQHAAPGDTTTIETTLWSSSSLADIFFPRPAGFCFEKWLSGHEPRFEKVETIVWCDIPIFF